ncbi:hypothetical protein GHT06_015065 [Daphnia sinensis]|uniref:Peptidase S1 domain-containing protein n=1 Tax=Daphnia sinensis TaxID=1820382 RepID=A0AAD5KQQ3_9CRUS|nr:hypothetical protein GHT06_015065 [Daphnia sinensis]
MYSALMAIGLLSHIGCVFSTYLPSVRSYEALGGVNDEDANKIVGGTPAAEGEFPYQAALNLSGIFCGGTLISKSIVLTAAHCLEGFSASPVNTFKVTVNTTKLSGGNGAIVRGVRKFVTHPLFNPITFDNDVALLALSYPIKNVRLSKLPSAYTTSTYAGQTAVAVGWGATSFGGNLSNSLLKASVTVLTNEACNLQYNNTITSNMVCASAPGKDACQGDSGGPLLVKGVQIGITSFGEGCADPRFAGVYTRVTRYLTWIQTISRIIQSAPGFY